MFTREGGRRVNSSARKAATIVPPPQRLQHRPHGRRWRGAPQRAPPSSSLPAQVLLWPLPRPPQLVPTRSSCRSRWQRRAAAAGTVGPTARRWAARHAEHRNDRPPPPPAPSGPPRPPSSAGLAAPRRRLTARPPTAIFVSSAQPRRRLPADRRSHKQHLVRHGHVDACDRPHCRRRHRYRRCRRGGGRCRSNSRRRDSRESHLRRDTAACHGGGCAVCDLKPASTPPKPLTYLGGTGGPPGPRQPPPAAAATPTAAATSSASVTPPTRPLATPASGG